jgi:simple sugar transport system ATP-binding protein
MNTPVLEAVGLTKLYGAVRALSGVSLEVHAGRVTCLLGDNGAGKSTIIKILAGVVQPDAGSLAIDGKTVELSSPRDALSRGIATVFQDLATAPVLPVWRNFCMGSEPTRGMWPFRVLDARGAMDATHKELLAIGIDIADLTRPISTLSGGQRQCVAIARAVHQGANVLILDEPTSALGVRQSRLVLDYIQTVKERGVGIVLVTHNPSHAYAVGDSFCIVGRGEVQGRWAKDEISLEDLVFQMSAGTSVHELPHGR